MSSRTTGRSVRAAGAAALMVALVALFALLPQRDATAAPVAETIAQGNIDVKVSETSGLVDGQTIKITVDAKQGAALNEVRATQCVSPVDQNFAFSQIGGFCATDAMSPGNVQNMPNPNAEAISGPFAPGTVTTMFDYKVGVGDQVVTDINTGDTRTISCGPGKTGSCFLVLWIHQSKDAETYFATPLAFSGAPGVTTTTAAGATTTTVASGVTTTTVATSPTTLTPTTVAGSTTTTTTTTAALGTTTTLVASTTKTVVPTTLAGGTSSTTTGATGTTSAVLGGGQSGGGDQSGGSTGGGSTGSGSLPLTGAQIGGLLLVGLALIGAGSVLVSLRRADA